MRRPKVVQLIALLLCVVLVFISSTITPAINQGRQSLNIYGSTDVHKNAPPEYAFAIQAFGAFRSLITNIAFIRAENYKEQGRFHDAMQLAQWICILQPHFPAVWEFQSWNMAWNISVTTFTPEERWNWVYNGVKLLRDQGIPNNERAVNLYKQLAWTFNNKMSENTDDFHWDYKRNWAWRMHLLLGPRLATLRALVPTQEDYEPVVFDAADDPLMEMARTLAESHEQRRQQRAAEEGVPYRTTKTVEERWAELAPDEFESIQSPAARAAVTAVYSAIKAIADAPATLEELYTQFPEIRAMVSRLREIGVQIDDDTLTEDRYWRPDGLAFTFFARYRQLVDTPALRESIKRDAEDQEITHAERELELLDEIIGARAGNPAGQALVRFLQRKILDEVYNLDAAFMAELVKSFGPLDWRMVDSQSLYWVTRGLIVGGETPSNFENDKTNTARLIFFSLRNLFNRNKVIFEPNPEDVHKSYINFAPDVDFIEPMHRAFIVYGPMIDPDPGNASGAGQVFRTGHVNFLSEAIRMLYFADRMDEAEHYYEYLRTHYAYRPDGSAEDRYLKPLRDFIFASFYETIQSQRETNRVIENLLYRAYTELSNENITPYNRLVAKALDFHKEYMKEHHGETGPRMQLPPFRDMQIDTFRDWLAMLPVNADPRLHDSNVTIRKSHLWRVAPLRLKQSVYDDLIPYLRQECDMWEFDVTKAFPEPPGMKEYRAAHPRRDIDRPDSGTETPVQPPGS
ncbi:MAG: hypothetical protein ABIG44_13440 [Planctomycetota bacterium]